jgi:hypothetical protein
MDRLVADLNKGLAEALEKASPELCHDIDDVLAQPGATGEDVMWFVEHVRLTMGRAAPLFPSTVDSMIQSYAQLKAAQRKKLE